MHTLRNIVIAIIGAMVFGLAFRIGYHAERDTMTVKAAQ